VPLDNADSELRELWRKRVEAAARAYELAKVEATQAMERLTCEATSQDIEALTEAHRRESAALSEYMRVMRIFHRLTVEGEKPET
jgi:hypothetical protein